jgi:hypothetical protein
MVRGIAMDSSLPAGSNIDYYQQIEKDAEEFVALQRQQQRDDQLIQAWENCLECRKQLEAESTPSQLCLAEKHEHLAATLFQLASDHDPRIDLHRDLATSQIQIMAARLSHLLPNHQEEIKEHWEGLLEQGGRHVARPTSQVREPMAARGQLAYNYINAATIGLGITQILTWATPKILGGRSGTESKVNSSHIVWSIQLFTIWTPLLARVMWWDARRERSGYVGYFPHRSLAWTMKLAPWVFGLAAGLPLVGLFW